MDVKKLSVVVEQKGIAPTSKNLERLAKASDTAAPAVERLSSSLGTLKNTGLGVFTGRVKEASDAVKDIKASTSSLADVAKNISGLSTNLSNIANATDRLGKSTSDITAYVAQIKTLRTELESMKGLSSSLSNLKVNAGTTTSRSSGGGRTSSVDPEVKAQQRLLTQIERSAMMAGKTKSEYLALRAAQLGVSDSAAPFISKLQESEKGFSKLGMSVKGYNAAMRMVPAQFTDIAVQLAGGQNPMLVLMQQGGQLKDVFGGVGNAMKAVGQQIATYMKNPLLLAAAALTTVVYALYKASTELDAFNKAVITTNGIAGIGTNTFYSLRDGISSIAGSKSDATEALTAIAASGKIASKDIEDVGVAAVKMNKVSGQAIAETVKEFESLAGKPSEAIIKLNDKYHFLTASVYDQITALEKQGKMAEASALATQAYETAINNMAAESTNKLGWVLSSWEAIKKAVISVKDAVLDLGVSSNNKQLNLLRTQIDDTQKAIDSAGEGNIGGRYGKSKSQLEDTLKSLVAQRDAIKETMAIEDRAAVIRKTQQDTEKKAVDARKKFGDIIESNLTRQEKKQKEINDLKKVYNDLENKTAQDTATYQRELAEIEKKYKEAPDRSAEKAQRQVDARELEKNAIIGAITALEAESRALDENGLAYDKVSQHMQNAAKWWAQYNDPNVSSAVKAKSLENALLEEQADKQQKVNEQKKADLKASEAYNEVVRKNEQDLADLNAQYSQEAMYIAMTTKEKTAAQALYANEVAMNKALLEIEKQRKNVQAGSKEEEYLNASIANTRMVYNEKAKLINANLALQEKELSWTENLMVATKQYQENLGTYNSQVQSGMMSVFSTLDGALTSFVSGTKTSFKDLTVSVLKQISVMLAKIAIMKAAMAVVGMVSGGSGASNMDTSSAGGFNTADWGVQSAKGNAFTGSGIAKFAKGSAFTNSVVTRPTAFAFASGGAFNNGLMGEAGPEAVMPLTRTANGNLGVETSGTGGTQNNVAVNVTMNSNGTSTTSTTSDDAKSAKAMGELIAKKVKEVISEQQRPGGLLATR